MEKDVPYIVYESEAARHERTVKANASGVIHNERKGASEAEDND